MAKTSDSRTLKGKVIRPREQFQFTMLFMAAAVVIMTAYTVIFLNSMQITIQNIAAESDASPDVIQALEAGLRTTMWLTGGFAVVLAAAIVSAGFALSHRIFGPSVQLVRTIENFRNGNYGYRGSLRKSDAYQDVMDELNALGGELERRHSGATIKT